MKTILTTFFAFVLLPVFASDSQADDILGVWQNGSGKGHILIYKNAGRYFGKIIWLKQPFDENGQPRVDKKNPDKDLSAKPLIGRVMLRDFTFDRKEYEWENGKVYNPKDGKEYQCVMKMKDNNTLDVRGFLGFSFIGKTDTWQRVR
jgi:uncharacterized protein (DUF2147 family)